MVWNTIRSTKNKYKVLLSQVCKFSLQKREREKNIKATEENTQNRIEELPIITIKDKEFLSFSEVGILLGITRQAVYKMVYKGYLQASKLAADYLSSNALI